MSTRLAPWILVAALAPGCSLILDTGDLPQQPDGRPGEIDAGPPDSRPVDANPMDFAVDTADPAELLEGVGAKGTPFVVRFYGMNIIEPMVTAAWSDGFSDPVVIEAVQASNTFDEVAVALRVPVRPGLDEGNCGGVAIHFDFMQVGATMADAVDVPLHCLDELADIAALDSTKTYSRIQVTAARHFAPGDPAPVLRAVEDIEISRVIDVDAGGTTAGAGSGCDGGAAGASSSCTGGGTAGATGGLDHGGGGGGGGYFTDGGGGVVAGAMHGAAMLVPLAMSGVEGNHGAGGGGGGAGTLGGPGVGGGGGGTIQLIAGGEIVVSSGALVRARGADGTNGTGLAATGSGGGGGGGSGGAILVRAGAGVRFTAGPFGWLATPRGLGGTSPGNGGGAGAEGRARVDQAGTADALSMIAVGGKASGPAWEPVAEPIVTVDQVQLRLRAQPGDYGVLHDDAPITTGGGNVTISSGSVQVTVTGLHRGRNTICALYTSIGAPNATLPEARTCLEVVYVPVDQ